MNTNYPRSVTISKLASITLLFVSLFTISTIFAVSAHAQSENNDETGVVSNTEQSSIDNHNDVVTDDSEPQHIESFSKQKDESHNDEDGKKDDSHHEDDSKDKKNDSHDNDTQEHGDVSHNYHPQTPPPPAFLLIIASAVTCNTEADLPNWGDGGPSVSVSTAASYVASHSSCQLAPGWNFQWGYGPKSGFTGVTDPGGSFIGPVAATPDTYNSWGSFGPTNAGGTATLAVYGLQGASNIWIREQLPSGYTPFSEPAIMAVGHKNNVSAETYCDSDVLNYDNFDAIYNAALGNTYYCVTFNALSSGVPTTTPTTTPHTNTPPVITITGSNPLTINLNTTFIDPGATATDTEDGNITANITASSSVATTTVGTYTIVYSVTDSGGLSASSTRVVNVVNPGDNGGPTNTPPVITITGENPVTIVIGTDYVDAGATATDTEDGNITANIVASSTVATTTVGSYTVTYVVTDSGGLTSTSTRVVNIVNPTPPGNPGGGGGGGGCVVSCGPNIGTGGGYGNPLFASTFAAVSAPLSCPLLTDFLRIDFNNNPSEVVKLQAFLQRTYGYDIDVNGTFDQKTLAGVNAFQTKYLGQVMGPWGATQPSGYVYITTKKKINEIACNDAFVINASEQAVIDAYKNTQNGIGGPNDSTAPNQDIGILNASSTNSLAAGDDFFNNPNTAAVGNTSIFARFWDFMKSLFARKN